MTVEAATFRRRLGRLVRRLQGGAAAAPARAPGRPSAAAAPSSGVNARSERIASVVASAAAPMRRPVVKEPRPRLALVAAADQVADLELEADVVVVRPDGLPAPSAAQVLLVQAGADGADGWPDDALADLATAVAAGRTPATFVWLTEAPGTVVPEGLGRLAQAAAQVAALTDAAAAAWRAALPDVEVSVLAPAVQPRRSSPSAASERLAAAALVLDDDVADASALPTTKSALALLDVWPLERAGAGVEVPDALAGRVARRLPRAQGLAVPRRYSVLLDTVRSAQTPITTLLAAGAAQTAVVTTPELSATLPDDLRPHVAVAQTPADVGGELTGRVHQRELRDREGLRLHRAVLAGHTTRHRLEQIQRGAGLPVVERDRSVSAVVPTNRDHELDNVLANLARQAHRPVQLVLVLHGLDVDEDALRGRAADAGVGDLVIVRADASLTLGACMNLGVAAADGRFVAKMDDDNHYGPHFLTDLVAAFDYTDAGIVGKWAHYVWLRSSGAVVLRQPAAEHTYERRVQGGSMVFDRDLLREVPFSDIPRAVDSDILDRSLAHGARVYSADRFNYVSIRGADRLAHTWTVADHTFMTATGQLQFYGDPREHVDV